MILLMNDTAKHICINTMHIIFPFWTDRWEWQSHLKAAHNATACHRPAVAVRTSIQSTAAQPAICANRPIHIAGCSSTAGYGCVEHSLLLGCLGQWPHCSWLQLSVTSTAMHTNYYTDYHMLSAH